MHPSEAHPTVLAVDDTEDIRELLKATLELRGFRVLTADGGRAMDAILAHTAVDLIVLDSMMPVEDGLSICARVSQAGGPPIIMLSAAGDDINRIKGLNLGAEDYMSKPFNADELAVRIRIVLRRVTPVVKADEETAFGWVLDNVTRRLSAPGGKWLTLSPAEFAVLHAFLAQRDRPLSRDKLLERMTDLHEDSTGRSLDTLISRLRRKLKYIAAPDEPELIQTVYGTGYMLRPN